MNYAEKNLTKEQFEEFLKNNPYKPEYWVYSTDRCVIHTDNIESVENILPNANGEYQFDYEVMDRDRYNHSILVNSGVDAYDFMEEDDRALVIVQAKEWRSNNPI